MAYLPCEGVFAINKPPSITSAQVIRDCQSHFKTSTFFGPWLEREQSRKDTENHNQRQKRRSWKQRQPPQVKIGHGGTLDPMATGVLVLGVGSGTKKLAGFLECTKSYEAVVLFGAATDSYDAVGKVIRRKEYGHVTREKVEEALGRFRGKIMQRPPIFSALRVQGKRLYEYAREGREVPVEIEERPVTVEKLELLEWMDGGSHEFRWPEEEAEREAKEVAEKVLHFNGSGQSVKRKRDDEEKHGEAEPSKRSKVSPEPPAAAESTSAIPHENEPNASGEQIQPPTEQEESSQQPCPAPACRLRMTVTSGFYVRSLCHDLGAAVESVALMSTLVRSRQGEFSLGSNALEYSDLEKGEQVWGPKVKEIMADWQEREGVEVQREGKERNDEERSIKKEEQPDEGASIKFERNNYGAPMNQEEQVVKATSIKSERKLATERRRRRNTSSAEDSG